VENLTHHSVLDLKTTREFGKQTVERKMWNQGTRRYPKPTEFSPEAVCRIFCFLLLCHLLLFS
jgi:hypothetical protein